MKKIIVTIIVCLNVVLFSCKKDDEAGGQDPIIGEWKLIARVNIVNEKPVTKDLGCELNEPVTIREDGTYTGTTFDQDIEGKCIDKGTFDSTWENVGTGKYTFDKSTVDIVFAGDTFTSTFTDEDGTSKDTYQK